MACKKTSFNRWIKRCEDGILCQLPCLAGIVWQYCWEDNKTGRKNSFHFNCQAYHILGFCNDAFLFLCFCSWKIREAEWTGEIQKNATAAFLHQLWSWGLVTARALWSGCSSQPGPSFSLILPFHLFMLNYNLVYFGQTTLFIYLLIYFLNSCSFLLLTLRPER